MAEPTPTDLPWQGDAVSLVDAFRAGERSPVEELEASIAAAARSELNAVSHLDLEPARALAATVDVSLPFGGVPFPVKQLTAVAGWPDTEASLALAGHVYERDATLVTRLRGAGALLFAATTASEFGGLSVGVTKENGVTRNPWNPERSTGGSSAGAAAVVAGGITTISTGGDGGGSIRKPCAYTGLFGFKGTYGVVPRGPGMYPGASTAVAGVMARSVRDVARFLQVAQGPDERDPYSWARIDTWERDLDNLGIPGLGLKVAIDPDLSGKAVVLPAVADLVQEAGEALAKAAGLTITRATVDLPGMGIAWAMAGLAEVRALLGDRWPACKEQLTGAMAFGMELSDAFTHQSLAEVEVARMTGFERMADVFDQVDLLICAVNPNVAHPAETKVPRQVGDDRPDSGNDGALTIPANIAGNPAISLPIGLVDGLPVGLQVIARHHHDQLLLDLAQIWERERPWPLVAPGSPR